MKKQPSGILKISGRAGSGKTALAIAAAQSMVQEGKKVLYLDGSGNFDKGEDRPEVFSYYCQVETLEDVVGILEVHLEDHTLGLAIIDGFDGLAITDGFDILPGTRNRFKALCDQLEGKRMGLLILSSQR